MKSALPLLISATFAFAWFGPSVRVDHENEPDRGCALAAITLGPGSWSSQPIYVAFEDDSVMGLAGSDIMFQKSTDAGRTWLPADVLVRRDACEPDITTDPNGNIYVLYYDTVPNRFHCVQSTDGGATWSSPTSVDDRARGDHGWIRIAADSAGNLLCAWNEGPLVDLHIFSSVSTDRGATWNPSVRVDDDTTNAGCYQADVFVQPGTNRYLVAAEVPCSDGHLGCYLYCSGDTGRTYQPGVRVDTFGGYAGQPHVVADMQHVIYDCTGGDAEARTWYTQTDTWGTLHFVGCSYASGAKLAISADGSVHTALMSHHSDGPYHAYYAFSSDHGVSWSDTELVSDDTTQDIDYPDIGADSAGHAYIVWQVNPISHGEIWFATNDQAGIAEQSPQQPIGVPPLATVIRNVLLLREATSRKPQAASSLLDIGGRQVMVLKPGANDVRALAPGVYFVREAQAQAQAQAVRKVVVTR